MRNNARVALAALAALVSFSALSAEPAIIPRPLHVAEQPGRAVRFGDNIPVLVAADDAEARSVADYLILLAHRTGGPRLISAARAGTSPAIRFTRRVGFAPEGYALDIDGEGASIAASTRAGFLYGAVSLWQLLTDATDKRIPHLHIDDAPRFPWRGMVLDSARHFQSPAAVARTLEWMALHKLNRLQWHLVDDQGWRLQIARYPRLTSVGAWRTTPPAAGLTTGRYGGFYTQAEVRRLVALAAARNITIVPEIELPGHATAAILAYPAVGLTTMTSANLGDWGVFPSIYGVDANSFTFIHDVLDEVMALFPSREIAIGGDEAVHTLWHDSPAVQARLHALGLKDETALQSWFVGSIGTYLNAHGRRLVGWDEILAGGSLPKQDIVLSWHGADGALAAARAGHDVVMATAPTLYFDNRQSNVPSAPPGRGLIVNLHDVYSYDPGNPPSTADTAPLDAESAHHIIGVEGALWSEHIATDERLEAMALPRSAALAEIGWTAEDRRDWSSFVARLPAMIARYHGLGLQADDGAFAVQAQAAAEGSHVRVSLNRQLDLGEIRYTTNGVAPTPASPRYAEPISLPLPGRLRAASFAGSQPLSRELDLRLDTVSATRRASQQLELCTDTLSLNLAGRPDRRGADRTYLVDIKNPCWIYRGAKLDHVGHIAVAVAALPFNYQLANETVPLPLAPVAAPAGELVVRRGRDGPVLATVPLPSAAAIAGGTREIIATLPSQAAPEDLYLTLTRPKPDPIWAIDWVELRP